VEPTGSREGGRESFSVSADAASDIRPAVFQLARDRGWTLYELHQESRSLEDLFQDLTREGAEAVPVADVPAPAGGGEVT
jgi:ABC-2 type transport system ATP-binding protein